MERQCYSCFSLFAAVILHLLVLANGLKLTDTNFLILLADDLGYGDLSIYGHPTSETGNLDRLASEGMKFTQFYSASPVCSPSRAAIVTGRLPARNGVYCKNGTKPCIDHTRSDCCNGVFVPGFPGGLPKTEVTFASALKDLNWKGLSGLIGKWHLGMGDYMPTKHGFDYYYGVPHGLGSCPCSYCFAGDQTCSIKCSPTFAPCPVFENETIVEQPANLLTLASQYVKAASNFMEKAVASNKPFLLHYCSHHTHSPQFAGVDTTGKTRRGRFGDSLAEFDHSVGELVSTLEKIGVIDNTLIWFTSDNGPSLRNEIRGGNAGLLKCGKGTTYEGGMRVPGIIRWPAGGIQAGSICREVVSTLDMFPTILNIATADNNGIRGVGAMKNAIVSSSSFLDGFDISSMLHSTCTSGPGQRNGKLIYYPQFARKDRGLFAVRSGKTKVHFHTRGSLQSGTSNPDKDCRPSANFTTPNPPLTYDLDVDASEIYELTGKEAENAVEKARLVAMRHKETMDWYPYPMLNNGSFNPSLWPCAKPGCMPFPSCCVTSKTKL
jgi:arylsulfatase A